LWVSRLVSRADARAAAASRVMSLAIGALSLLIAAAGAARYALPSIDERLGEWSLAIGAALIAVVAIAYAAAMRLAPRARTN
jgi:hypothetical protein